MGQETFYSKLSYKECEPVSLYAFGLRSNSSVQTDNKTENIVARPCKTMIHNISSEISNEKKCLLTSAPPPPPPLPKLPLGQSVMTAKTYMKKELAKS